jgi:NADPH:quinone reductase-like Zn-dependent oxidoreductase
VLTVSQRMGHASVGLTAWQALTEVGRVEAGQRVLIHAAAGGLGHVAVQIAKALGAHVIGTASAAKHDFLRSLGADELIDHREVDFAHELGETGRTTGKLVLRVRD